MKRYNAVISFVGAVLLCQVSFFKVAAMGESFLLRQVGCSKKTVKVGGCARRYPPCSTFKLPLALVAKEAGVIKSATQPQLRYNARKHGRDTYLAPGRCTPKKWLKNSVVWYSWEVAQKIGLAKFKQGIRQLDYGNQDLSRSPLKYAWLTGEFEGRQLKNGRLAQGCVTGSLRISPKEQLDFLEKLVSEQHSAFSKQTQKFVKDICPTKAKLSDGTPVYGKTGAGTLKSGRKIGWLVGWTKNKDKDYCYAYLNENEDSKATVKERWQNVKYRLEKAFGDKA